MASLCLPPPAAGRSLLLPLSLWDCNSRLALVAVAAVAVAVAAVAVAAVAVAADLLPLAESALALCA